jgi:selenocysteine lyase/cysteine desulfurase
VIGGHEVVPALGGAIVRYVNFDNAATTPLLRATVDAVEDLRQCPPRERAKSPLCTVAYEQGRQTVGDELEAQASRW